MKLLEINNKTVNWKYILVIILFAGLVGGFGFYYFWKIPEATKMLVYENDLLGLKFKYPDNLYFYDVDENGKPALPRLFFEDIDDPYTVNDCKNGCIVFAIFNRESIEKNMSWMDANYYDKELKDILGASFPIYACPKYVYKDENNEMNINNNAAKRYYSVGPNMIATANSGRKSGDKYAVEELIYIKDPYTKNRIIYIQYQEIKDDLPIAPKSTNSQEIKNLFDKNKSQVFHQILENLELSPIKRDEYTEGKIKEQKIIFEYPKYWGELIEEKRDNTLFEGERLFIRFENPLYAYSSPTEASLNPHNEKTASWSYEAFLGYLAQYSGQPIGDFCESKGYLNSTGAYDIEVSNCELRALDNGIKVGLIEGKYAATSIYMRGEIPKSERIYKYFKVASVKTKSNRWPGLNIVLSGSKENVDSEAADFNHIVSSLNYYNE